MNDPDDAEAPRYHLPMRLPPMADTPLNGRQEAFAQGMAKGWSKLRAAREAGYRGNRQGYKLMNYPNVRARVTALQAETAATARIEREEIVERLLGIAAWGEASDSVSGQNLARQALLDLARMHGYLNGKGEQPAPPLEPITEIRRVIVYPDGREEEY